MLGEQERLKILICLKGKANPASYDASGTTEKQGHGQAWCAKGGDPRTLSRATYFRWFENWVAGAPWPDLPDKSVLRAWMDFCRNLLKFWNSLPCYRGRLAMIWHDDGEATFFLFPLRSMSLHRTPRHRLTSHLCLWDAPVRKSPSTEGYLRSKCAV